MPTTREKIVKQAQAWLGYRESDGTHKKIIDVYNADKPLPRGYKVSYTDAWCATFVTACAIKCGATDIIPKECSCNKMIELFKKLGCFVEDDAYVPLPGDIIFYDWEDTGTADNKGNSDHVGIVEKISGNTITVIEGNYSNSCKRRTIKVNGRYIRGYGVPKYTASSINISLPVLTKGSKGASVKALQMLLNGHGFTDATEKVLVLDGSFGNATCYALKAFQTAKGLEVTGICEEITWASLLA